MSIKDDAVIGHQPKTAGHDHWAGAIAIVGFVLVAAAQATNMILARGLAGTVPPFTLAFFRWAIIAGGLAPVAVAEIRSGRLSLRADGLLILTAGFFGMFICGGPVYIAGITTTAINIALIMSLSPIVVMLLSRIFGLERIGVLQVIGMGLALIGALLIVSHGDPRKLIELRFARGDLLTFMAMLGWSGYTLLQSRVATSASFLARVSAFATAGAMFTFPAAVMEMWSAPHSAFASRALAAYLFAGLVPGILAYAGFAYLGTRFGSVRASITLYLGPVASALLSWTILGEAPTLIHVFGGTLIFSGVWASLKK